MQKFKLLNLDCPGCAKSMEDELLKMPSVNDARISFTTSTLWIDTSDLNLAFKKMKEVEPDLKIIQGDEESFNKNKIFYIIFFIAALIFSFFVKSEFLKALILTVIYVYCGFSVYKKAYFGLKRKDVFNENLLMVVATLGAFYIGQNTEAVGVMLFYSVGEYLQGLAISRSKKRIEGLMAKTSMKANRLRGDLLEEVHPSKLKIGDLILVKQNEALPVDGIITKGESFLDTKVITGEPRALKGRQGESVLAGFVVLDEPLEIKVTKEYSKSFVYKVLELIEEASTKKAKIESLISKIAKIYTPAVFALSFCIAVLPPLFGAGSFDEYLYRALVILVVSCPCALMLSIPLSYFGGIGLASKAGILIRGANVLDALRKVKKIAFDKTGTLTLGVFAVSKIVPQEGVSKAELLNTAIRAESLCNHPIAKSILEYAHEKGIKPMKCCKEMHFSELSGKGVKATCAHTQLVVGNDKILHEFNIPHDTCDVPGSVVHVASNGKYLGYLLIADELKADSENALDELKKLGIHDFAILSGDGKESVERVGHSLGISKLYSQLLPTDKLEVFKQFKNESLGVSVFVGDGTNDAPVLAAADVGVGMMLGSDISKQSADVVLMSNSLKSLVSAIKISHDTRRLIVENIVLVVLIKALFLSLGAFGEANLWEAVFADVGVSMLAVFNTLRLLKKSY